MLGIIHTNDRNGSNLENPNVLSTLAKTCPFTESWGSIDSPGKKQSFLFISHYCVEIKFSQFNIMGMRINMIHTI